MKSSPVEESIDLFADEFLQDPYPTYRQLRTEDPVHYHERWGGWLLTRYDHVKDVLGDTDTFSSLKLSYLIGEDPDASRCPFAQLSRWMSYKDGPNHRMIRDWISKSFSVELETRARPYVEDTTEKYLERLESNQRLDLLNDFSKPLVQSVMDRLFGIPTDARKPLQSAIGDFLEYTLGIDPGAREPAEEAIRTMDQVLRDLVRERRDQPRDDLITDLLENADNRDELDEDDLVANCMNLLTAGYESTGHQLANGFYTLLRRPSRARRLGENPDRADLAFEEILRYEGVFEALSRRTKRPVEFNGTTIPAGEQVTALLAAANRDPRQFEDPESFDMERDPNRHLGFGKGSHFCPGAGLARVIGRTVLARTAPYLSRMELVEDRARWRSSFVTRLQAELPVELEV